MKKVKPTFTATESNIYDKFNLDRNKKFQKSGLRKFAKIFEKRRDKNYDSVICLTGMTGSGKSTLAMLFALIYDRKFTLKRNVLYNPTEKDLKDKLLNLPRGSAIVLDEAIKILYALDWQKGFQKILNKLFALVRERNHLIIICIPNFNDLSKYYRDNRVLYWVHVLRTRGSASIFEKSIAPNSPDPWNLLPSQKIFKDFIKEHGSPKREEKMLRVLRTYPNYVDSFVFPPLPKNFFKIYEKERDKVKYIGLDFGDGDSEDKKTIMGQQQLGLGLAMLEMKKAGFKDKETAEITKYSLRRTKELMRKAKDFLEKTGGDSSSNNIYKRDKRGEKRKKEE